MTVPSLPDFDRALQLSRGSLDAAGLAECHGLLCGLACRQVDSHAGDYLQHLSEMQLVPNPGDALRDVLSDAWQCTLEQLNDEDLGFELWLPEDDEPLEERTLALGRWCSGFLAGLGSGGQIDALSEDMQEAIADLQEIARVEMAGPPSGDEENEDEESAFVEIVEYVRVVALTMWEEFRGPETGDLIH